MILEVFFSAFRIFKGIFLIIDLSESSKVLVPHLLLGRVSSSLYLGDFPYSVLFSLILLVTLSDHMYIHTLYCFKTI